MRADDEACVCRMPWRNARSPWTNFVPTMFRLSVGGCRGVPHRCCDDFGGVTQVSHMIGGVLHLASRIADCLQPCSPSGYQHPQDFGDDACSAGRENLCRSHFLDCQPTKVHQASRPAQRRSGGHLQLEGRGERWIHAHALGGTKGHEQRGDGHLYHHFTSSCPHTTHTPNPITNRSSYALSKPLWQD